MKLLKIIVLSLIFFLVACSGKAIEPNMSADMQDFEFITQDHEKLALEDLEGEWWIASFIYTNCKIACPTMTANLARIQSMMQEENVQPRIVSFSIDPEFDSPEVLKTYAAEYGADLEHWTFLTGYEFSTIKDISVETFQTNLQEGSPENPNNLTAHGTNFFLVDPEGRIIKKYDGMGVNELDEIVEDLKKVL